MAGGVQQAEVDEFLRVRRRQVDDVDALLRAVRGQGVGVAAQFLVQDVDLMALDQPQQLFPRHVERERHRV
ncbi:hypothetical protein, partial [Spirillospora albida]|uniref:hypothetical protein n=1 Tax=Spirillospora albida TaxID=58123 RepID=UPI0004BFB119